MRFHSHHGKNVHIADDGLIATRTCSFAHGICFGNRPLNQVVLLIKATIGNTFKFFVKRNFFFSSFFSIILNLTNISELLKNTFIYIVVAAG